jgi:hypothetical protein
MQPSYTTTLHINSDKLNPDHPDFSGQIDLDGETYKIALWHARTKDNRHKFTGSLQLKGDKNAERFKVWLFEFRRKSVSDPHFYSPEGTVTDKKTGETHDYLVHFDDTDYRAYLFISKPNKNSERTYTLELSTEQRQQKLSQAAQEFEQQMAALADAPLPDPDDDAEPDDFGAQASQEEAESELLKAVRDEEQHDDIPGL